MYLFRFPMGMLPNIDLETQYVLKIKIHIKILKVNNKLV